MLISIFFLCDLDPEHMLKLKSMESKTEYKFYFPSSTSVPKILDNAKLMMSTNGELKNIINYDMFLKSVYGSTEDCRRVDILNKIYQKYISTHTINNDILIKLKNKLIDDKLPPLEYGAIAFEIALIYMYLNEHTEELTTGDNENKVIESVADKYGEKEIEVTNELEMLSVVLNEKFTKDQINNMNILKASYNGKDMESDEILGILSTHVLPQYLTQIDIRDTKDDTYTIETDLCTIIREPETMEFKIIEKEND